MKFFLAFWAGTIYAKKENVFILCVPFAPRLSRGAFRGEETWENLQIGEAMREFIAKEYGRTLVIHLGKGELLLESVQKALEEKNIKNAVLLSAIGSLRKLSMHIIMDTEDNATNHFLVVEKPFELCAMQGLVLNGVPHFHMVCSAPGNESFCGHVEEGCEVQYLMEIALLEIKDMNLTRRKDAFNIDYIDEL